MSAAYLTQDSSAFLSYPVDWPAMVADRELHHRLTLVLETGYGQIERYRRLRSKIFRFVEYLEEAVRYSR